MSRMIQLRNVPDALHRQLKSRAALEGLSLSDFLIREARRAVERPSPAELAARIRDLGPAPVKTPPAEVVRSLRDRG